MTYKPRYALYAVLALILLSMASVVFASSITPRFLGARTMPGFCDGVRYDGVSYEDFILARNSGSTLRISENHACRWLDNLQTAQRSMCGSTNIVKPETCDKYKRR